jgi:ankyrin repeat protein
MSRRWLCLALFLTVLCGLPPDMGFAQVRSDFARVFGDDLTEGIQRGDRDAVNRALIRGHNPSKRYAEGKTPLMLAAVEGQVEIARMLLNYGARIRTRDKLGNTALIYAASAGHHEVLEALLDNGAPIDERNKRGVSALIIAARRGHAYVAERLVDRGADTTLTDHTGRSALDWARQSRRTTIVRLLEKAAARE